VTTIPPITVDRRSGLTPEEFRREYYEQGRPVVMTDASRSWQAHQVITPDWLRRTHGSKKIQVGGTQYEIAALLDILEAAKPGEPTPYPCIIDIPADWPEAAERLVDERLNRLSELPGIEGDAVYGGPREELSRFSGEVDLLIVGSRGYGPLGRLLHGSISRYLVRHAACPLLVLARGPVLAAAADTADRPRTSTALPV